MEWQIRARPKQAAPHPEADGATKCQQENEWRMCDIVLVRRVRTAQYCKHFLGQLARAVVGEMDPDAGLYEGDQCERAVNVRVHTETESELLHPLSD